MAITYTIISSVTVGSGGAASISFSSIPQIYTDLFLLWSGRTTNSTLDSVYMSLNGSTSNFYTPVIVYGDGSSASVFSQNRYAGTNVGSSNTADVFSNTGIYIISYTDSNKKLYSVDSGTETMAATAYDYFSATAWNDSAAITSLTLTPNAGTFVQYSSAYLYGIKNS